jgi:pimeloyl-ACP methyl ester carboxylesterase
MPTITVNGHTLHTAEAGSGPAVVMVHGTLQDQRYWAPQMAPLAEAGFRAIALSLRHFWPEQWDGVGDDFTIAQHMEDVAAVIRTLEGPVRLIGHSRGGHIAFRLAGAYPELLHQLVLAEPGGELDETLGGEPATGAQAGVFAKAAAMIGAGQVEEGMAFFADYTGGAGAWGRRPEARRQVARDNARTLLGQVNENRKPYGLAAVLQVVTPTLLVGGANTQPQFNVILAAMQRHLPHCAGRVSVPRATHSMSLENPTDFNAAVLEFFAGA